MARLRDLHTMRAMRQAHLVLIVMIALALGTLVITQSACTQSASPTTAAASTNPPPSPIAPIGTVKQIMKGNVDPNSAALWDAVSTESGPKGDIEKAPTTDEEWARLEGQALTLAEVANLLKMPGRLVARPDEGNIKSQPDAPELTPVADRREDQQGPRGPGQTSRCVARDIDQGDGGGACPRQGRRAQRG